MHALANPTEPRRANLNDDNLRADAADPLNTDDDDDDDDGDVVRSASAPDDEAAAEEEDLVKRAWCLSQRHCLAQWTPTLHPTAVAKKDKHRPTSNHSIGLRFSLVFEFG